MDNFFGKHFYFITGFCKICKFFADSKSRAQDLSKNVSFVIFGHQTWDLEGGGQIDPPPSVSWFSSTPAGIGLSINPQIKSTYCGYQDQALGIINIHHVKVPNSEHLKVLN